MVIIGQPPYQALTIGTPAMPTIIAGELVSTSELQMTVDRETSEMVMRLKRTHVPEIQFVTVIDDSKKRQPHEYRTHNGHRKHGHKRRKK